MNEKLQIIEYNYIIMLESMGYEVGRSLEYTFLEFKHIYEKDFLNIRWNFLFNKYYNDILDLEDCEKEIDAIYKDLELYRKTLSYQYDFEEKNRINKYLLKQKLDKKLPEKDIKEGVRKI